MSKIEITIAVLLMAFLGWSFHTLSESTVKDIPAGKDIAQHVLENTKLGTTKTMLSDSASAVKSLSGQIDDILANRLLPATQNINATKVGQAFNKNSLLKSVAQSYGKTGGGGTITGKEVLKNILKIAPQVKGLLSKDNLTLPETNTIRKAIDQSLGDKFFTMKHTPFIKEVAGAFNSFVRDAVKKAAPETIPVFDELSKEITLRNALTKQIGKSGKIGLTDILGGITGFMTHGPLGAAGAIATERAARSPAVGIGVAKGLSKLGGVAIPQAIKKATGLGITGAITK